MHMGEQTDTMEILGKDPATEMLATIQQKAAPLIYQPWPEVVQEIMKNTSAIMKENAGLAIDRQSKTYLLPTAAFMLASYRVLLNIIGDKDRVIEILAAAVAGQWSDVEGHLRRRLGITQDAPEKAYEMCRMNFKKIGDEQFGHGYQFEQESSGDEESCVNVRKCFFYDFLTANGALELLLPVSCMQDDIWMKELNKPKYKMCISRPSMLPLGSDACRYVFKRKA
jgi:hypothetical protein